MAKKMTIEQKEMIQEWETPPEELEKEWKAHVPRKEDTTVYEDVVRMSIKWQRNLTRLSK